MKRLGTINVLGSTLEVIIATPAEVGDENLLSDQVHATFEGDTNIIRLNQSSSLAPGQARGNLLHEMVHAWFKMSGAGFYLHTLLPDANGNALERAEETLVRMLTPAIDSSLNDLFKMLCKRK